ncbi:MAG: deoxyribodipyrimidine photo-lyase [Anaerolineae bacterium]|nr:deoxyribodipyrimidine photo-lyase [Anaerolineae bacterium]
MPTPILHWFRRDLRLSDNLALHAAAQSVCPIIPVFIFDPALVTSSHVSVPRLAFLLRALTALDAALREQGSRLIIRMGDPRAVLPALIRDTGAEAIYLNRDYTPYALRRDAEIERLVGVPVHAYDDALLAAPGTVLSDAGKLPIVFTPFKRKWLPLPKTQPVPAPPRESWAQTLPPSDDLPTLASFDHSTSVALPKAGEAEALRRLNAFLDARVYAYGEGRNLLPAAPDDDTLGGSSFLSPYLRFGMLSPRQAYWGARAAYASIASEDGRTSVETWVSELVWREFYMHILHDYPHVLQRSFRPAYDAVQWRHAPDELDAWKHGMTGYPVVDAAMRQLRVMGWMPNRARMIVASFLTKDLLIDWRLGERHFIDWLIDGDPAANNGGWQWTAGTGTDAQPYFRIFNPLAQSQKFDPHGVYIRRWLPELRDVPDAHIHAPWEMRTPPADYPAPIVDHSAARERTLAAYQAVEKKP